MRALPRPHAAHCRCRACGPLVDRAAAPSRAPALAIGIAIGALAIELAALAADVASPILLLVGAA